MNELLKLFFGTLLIIGLITPVYATSETSEDSIDETSEEAAIDFLMDIDLEELGELEVTLDDVFDVFDGLIKKRSTKMATGAKQSIERAPSVTTVITAQDIEAIGATDLDDALKMVPGLHVSKNYVLNNSIYTIRGMHSTNNPEVLVLINGIPSKTLFFGNRNRAWGGMPVNFISRIEIVRGPGSAVFGADAFSGVINIITKTKDDINGTEIGIRTGSFDTQDAWVLHGSSWKGFDIAAALEFHDTDGHSEIIEADAQTYFDKVHNTDVSLTPGPVNMSRRNMDARLDIAKGNWQFRTGYQGRRDMGVGVGTSQVLDPDGRYEADRINADLTYHNPIFTKYWDVTAQASHYDAVYRVHNQTLNPPGFNNAYPSGRIGDPAIYERHARFDLSGFYTRFNKHLIRAGTGYYYGDLYKFTQRMNFSRNPATGKPLPPSNTQFFEFADTKFAAVRETSRENWYIFLQDTWSFMPNWELTAGVRYDDYDDFGSTVNPRLALVWQTRPNLTTKLLYGSAFRAPSFTELYNKSPLSKGNPNLKPEIIQTLELAFDYRANEKLNLALSLFTYKIDDVIRSQSEPLVDSIAKNFTVQNADTQTGHGFETEIRWKLFKNFSLLGNYSFQRSIDDKYDHDVGKAPQHKVYLRSDWMPVPNWYIDTQLNWVADRARAYGDSRPELDDYATIDLTLRHKEMKAPWNIALIVHNLFDTDAYEPTPGPNASGFISIPNDLPLAGRQWLLELRYKF